MKSDLSTAKDISNDKSLIAATKPFRLKIGEQFVTGGWRRQQGAKIKGYTFAAFKTKAWDYANGPKRGPNYNPNYGYEPYWEGGDWVFNTTTAGPDNMCGTSCPSFYKDYGVVCVMNNNWTYLTVNDYCQVLRMDCKNKEEWTIVYRGVCHPDTVTLKYKPTFDTSFASAKTRADVYMREYNERGYTTLNYNKDRLDFMKTKSAKEKYGKPAVQMMPGFAGR